MQVLLYIFAVISLLISLASIYMTLISAFPIKWVYYHYFIRKPIVLSIFIISFFISFYTYTQVNSFPFYSIIPLIIMAFAVVLSYKMHQENAFKAVDFPKMSNDISLLPIKDDMDLAVIEYGGEYKAYPLDYVIHHHIINDSFGKYSVSLTYCAMCRTIIPFDISDIGPLFVGSFKNANMIVADKKTKTFFQQATFESLIGKLHPHTLKMIPFQILSWKEIKKLTTLPQVVEVTKDDLKEFELPIKSLWKKIIKKDLILGLAKKDIDKTLSPRTRVIGLIDKNFDISIAYIKEELVKKQIIKNEKLDLIIISIKNTPIAFKSIISGYKLDLNINSQNQIYDKTTNSIWDMRGNHILGKINHKLELVTISDEYWFSWKRFHPNSILIRV